jgi:O-antigen/teichoic acid export membrane protein
MPEISNRKNYLWTLMASFGGLLTNMLIGIISVPISLNYWKVERYGVWALITSVLVYLGVSNLGLTQAAGVLIAKNTKFNVKIVIVKRAFKILIVSILIGCCAFLLLNIFNKNWVMLLGKIPANLQDETYKACFILALFFFINMPFGLLTSLLNGVQKAYIENIFTIAQSIITFSNLLLVIYLKGNLVTFALANGISGFALGTIKAVYFYCFIYKGLNVREEGIDEQESNEIAYRNIFRTGIRFFVIGVAAMFVWNTDNFVISNFIGIKEITAYSITFKLYSILFGIIAMINGAILPLMAKELGNKNWDWLNKIYGNLLIFVTIVGGLTWLGGVLFFQDVIALWAGKSSYAGILTVMALGAYSYLLSMVNLNSGIINSFNYTKHAPAAAWLEALVKLGISVVLVGYIGIAGVAVGTFLGSLFAPSWILPHWIESRTGGKLKYNLKFVLHHLLMLLLPAVMISLLVQLFVQNMNLRIAIGIVVIVFYVLGSILLTPVDVKIFFRHQLSGMLLKKTNLLPKNGMQEGY